LLTFWSWAPSFFVFANLPRQMTNGSPYGRNFYIRYRDEDPTLSLQDHFIKVPWYPWGIGLRKATFFGNRPAPLARRQPLAAI
jgi:hypothetical protein